MKGYTNNSLTATLGNERGSSALTFAGYAIIIVVIIGAFMLFSSGQFGKSSGDDYVAGMNALKDGKFDSAAALFTKAIQAKPENVSAFLGRSRAYVGLNQLDKALSDADQAIKMKASAQAYVQKAIVEKKQNKIAEALKDFDEAIKMDKSLAAAYAQRADLYYRQNELDKALADLKQALSSKPDFVDFIRLRGWVHSKMGKCKEASEDFILVEKKSPKDPRVIQDKAWFLLTCPDEKLQDSAKAMELAKEAEKLDKLAGGKETDVIQETLAEAFFKKGDFLNAVEHQRKAVDLNSKKSPDSPKLKEMQQRLQKYEMAARQETRTNYDILSPDSGL